MKLYGQTWTRRELEARVGRIEQIGGVRRFRWSEGPETGVEQIQVRTGAGLTYYVTPDRGLDISLAEYQGVPLSWQSANGEVQPAHYDPRGLEWLRTAVGGLLMTCGLTQVGSPNEDEGQQLGLHGRAHHLAARQVAAQGTWVGDYYEMTIRGVIEETMIFSTHLRLTRTIKSTLGKNTIAITDVVENIGFASTPHMLLYHFNFGFPLLSEITTIEFPSQRAVPREAETPPEGYDSWQSPQAGFREQVYYHEDLTTDSQGWASTLIRNPAFPLDSGLESKPVTLRLSWAVKNLPRLIQWKMPGAGVHVLGIEPANCLVEGRAFERERGTLVFLEPGERRTYELRLDLE